MTPMRNNDNEHINSVSEGVKLKMNPNPEYLREHAQSVIQRPSKTGPC